MESGGKPKIYYSFQESESANQHTEPYSEGYSYQPAPGKLRFGSAEILQISIAILVLTISFVISISNSEILKGGDFWNINPRFFSSLPVAFFTVLTGFMLHEMAHKFTAMHYGMWSEFRASASGLIMTLVLALIAGIVFAAPGAVMIFGRPNKKENGVISAAGPLTNLVIAGLAMLPFLFFGASAMPEFLKILALINGILAAFNLLPIPPLDGSKILKWNVGIYLAMAATCALVLYEINLVAQIW
ncbi:MAG: site-2 protease family protein [Candidatus Thermoplasmatota archaeon]|nr:site-2 protease family protein [Candidatus Thermoplasmatota archaeon]